MSKNYGKATKLPAKKSMAVGMKKATTKLAKSSAKGKQTRKN